MKKGLVLVAGMLLAACSGLDLEKEARRQIQEMTTGSELGTTEYTVVKIVKASDNPAWKIGDRTILFSTTTYLKAGIDLSHFNEKKTVIDADEKSISLTLPHAQLLSMNMPADEVKQVYQNVGLLRSNFNSLERNHILQLGEAEIRKSIGSMGILQEAERNAANQFRAALTSLGYETVNINFE